MGKEKKAPPPSVVRARRDGDRQTLSLLGQFGARRKAEIAALDREREKKRMNEMLAGASEMAQQANEHVCPVE